MKYNRLLLNSLFLSILLFVQDFSVSGQDRFIPVTFEKVIELYRSANYIAAGKLCDELLKENPYNQPLRYDLNYYRLMCLVKQNDRQAEKEISDYIENNQGSPWENQLLFELGRFQFSNRRYKSAVKSFEQTDPAFLSQNDQDDYYFYTGYSYFETGNLKKASQYFFDVRKGNSVYASSASYYWGYINYLEGNYETALQEFRKLENNKNFSGFISYYTIQIYYLQEKYDLVIDKGEKIVNIAPAEQRNELLKILGNALFETGQYIRAVKYLDAYQGINGKKSREDFYRLAICYDQIKEYSNAIEAFRKVTVQNDLLAQNAFYHLAGCYLKMNDKRNARTAFEQASKFSFDPKIEEDALFNYAKLSYELSYSPFNETIKAFDQYIAKYPDSERNDAAFDYLVKVFMTTRNYQDAIRSIEKIKVKSPAINEAYQRVTYYRGLELFNDGHYLGAIEYFNKSIENGSYNRSYKAQALYWKAEANYRLDQFNQALEGFTAYQATPGAFSTPEFGTAYYNIGYCYFNQKRYIQASEWFRKYLNQSKKEPKQIADACNRIADCFFLDREYEEAITYYTRSYEMNLFDPDYALFQRSICKGLNRLFESKIDDLNLLINEYPRSSFVDDALFEIARTHERMNSFYPAIDFYTKLLAQFPNSQLNKRALLQLGIISYNQSDLNASLKYYKQLVEKYPNTEESRAALVGIKNIYIEQNKVDDYFTYAETIGNQTVVSSSAQDSLFYITAEKQYMSGAKNSDNQFLEYLTRFPDGNFIINALYYLAEFYYSSGSYTKALDNFTRVISFPDNIFTEPALSKAGELNLNAGKFDPALTHFQRLESHATTKWNLLKARTGIMRCLYGLNKYELTIESASKLLATENVTEQMIREAHFKLGKSYYQLNKYNDALSYFSKTAEDTKIADGAESKYLKAQIFFNMERYEECENEIMDFIGKNTPHQYWLAKSFILLSDIYYKKNDLFQARHTLKSILDNYSNQEDGIIENARQKIRAIEQIENKNILENDSSTDSINNQ